MQLDRSNFRYRGYRESFPLVQLAKAAACDLTLAMTQAIANENTVGAASPNLQLIDESYVAQLQHYRAQIFYRLKQDM